MKENLLKNLGPRLNWLSSNFTYERFIFNLFETANESKVQVKPASDAAWNVNLFSFLSNTNWNTNQSTEIVNNLIPTQNTPQNDKYLPHLLFFLPILKSISEINANDFTALNGHLSPQM